MNKIIFLMLVLLCVSSSYAQNNAIKITNQTSGKETIIKETKKVRIKNSIGQEFSGRFVVNEEGLITINGQSIDLKNITEISRNPAVQSLFTRGLLIYGGAVVTGVGVLIGAFGNPAGFLLVIPGAAMIYTGIKSKNFNKRYRADDNWSYELVTVQ